MRRPLLGLSLLLLFGCGASPSDETKDGPNCSAQTDCDLEWRKVCEDGYCSAMLPANGQTGADGQSIYSNKLNIALKRKPKGHESWSFRVLVVYPVTPSGKTVACSGIETAEALLDAQAYNLTASPFEGKVPTGDVIKTLVSLNGPGRVVYVEIYDGPLRENPNVVGIGCLENPIPNEDNVIGMSVRTPA